MCKSKPALSLVWEGRALPRIGLLSDSHGRSSTTRRAVELLVQHGAEMLLHLGDVGTVEVIDALVVALPDGNGSGGGEGGQMPARLVFGNTDWDRLSLERYARELGVEVDDPVGWLNLSDSGKQTQLVYCHGDDPEPMNQAIKQEVKYLCHGHTHRFADTMQGATRVINPGALFRASQYTVAILDTQADRLESIALQEV